MGSAAFDYSVYCDRCGEAYAPKKPVCAGCGAAPARHWLQLTSLMVLVLAAFCNSLVCWFCLLYTSPSPRDLSTSRMPSSA